MAASLVVIFSSQAAIWNPIGAIADLVYMALFAVGVNLPGYLGGNKNARTRKIKEVFFGLLLGFTGYILFILISGQFTVLSGWVSLSALWIACIIFYLIFQKMQAQKTARLKIVPAGDILLRGLFGGSVVVAIVILGDSAGYMWGGLVSSFPGTIALVLILLHMKNGKDMSCGVIKSAPIGLGGTGLYSCMVWLSYPAYGIIAGTLLSYLSVLVFLSMIFSFSSSGRNMK